MIGTARILDEPSPTRWARAPDPTLLVVFGAMGDLVRNRLLPALNALVGAGHLGPRFALLGVDRVPGLDFAARVQAALQEHGEPVHLPPDALFGSWFDPLAPERLVAEIARCGARLGPSWQTVFHLAVPSEELMAVVGALGEAGLLRPDARVRVVVDRPYGTDAASAAAVDRCLHAYLDDGQVFRIDDDLARETAQDLLVLRLANPLIEAVWSRAHVEDVQIMVADADGVGDRGACYEDVGVVRDMVHNRAMQIVAMLAMEAPERLERDAVRAARLQVLRAIPPVSAERFILGQYASGGTGLVGYRDEVGVAPDSRTPTFASLALQVETPRWAGVPFHVRAGKRMARSLTQVVVRFRAPPVELLRMLGSEPPGPRGHASLVLHLQPDHGFSLHVQFREPGWPLRVRRAPLSFRSRATEPRPPSPYEGLLLDVLHDHGTLFAGHEEVAACWQVVAPMLGELPVWPYPAGSWGPDLVDSMWMAKDEQWASPLPAEGADAPTLGDAGPDGRASFGRFVVSGLLGSGGMGEVFEAEDPLLGRTVAIKIVRTQVGDEDLRQRFLAEARVTSQLEHPNIVPIYDLGLTDDHRPYLVMQRIQGRTLRAMLEDGAADWPVERRLGVFVAVCQAVACAHERGVLHRDLKPENVMLGAYGEVRVMDWGLARLPHRVRQSDEGGMTRWGEMLGTEGYASPEQCAGDREEVGTASDVWALGALLFELLTLRRAYEGSAEQRVIGALTGPPALPDTVPEELAGPIRAALSPRVADRPPSASALMELVQRFLERSERRVRAQAYVREAREAWASYRDRAREAEALLRHYEALYESTPHWLPLQDKAALFEADRRQQQAQIDVALRFAHVVGTCERALSQDPDLAEARELLAEIYLARFEEAEAGRSAEDIVVYEARVRAYAGPALLRRLEAGGKLTLDTSPSGAEVWCARVVQDGLVWPLGEPVLLGRTPLRELPLEAGSYVLTLRREGFRDTTYPVWIRRQEHWEAGAPVPLLTEAELGPGWCHVPGGPTIAGGDPKLLKADPLGPRRIWVDGFLIATFPVTAGQYAEFLTALHQEDPEAAWARSPRHKADGKGNQVPMWPRPGPDGLYLPPEKDAHGDRWDPAYPIFAVSWDDAMAYCAWASRVGPTVRLLREEEYEKAARGADGRFFPWGDTFDAALCKTLLSRPGRPLPEPVGAFPTDRSVYGARDLAGGIRQWMGDSSFQGDSTRRPIRGGAWCSFPRLSRAANAYGHRPFDTPTFLGFRLARDLPPTQSDGGTR